MIEIKHGNARGTGAMLRIDAEPCRQSYDGSQEYNGYLSMRFFAQKKQEVSSDSSDLSPVFEFEGISVRLYLEDISKFLEVFRGYEESICNGKGIYIRYGDDSIVNIKLRHSIDPFCGYELSITKKTLATDEVRTVSIFLTNSEALCLSLAIENVMGKIAFGI